MRRRSLNLFGSMILIATAVAISPEGLAHDKARGTIGAKERNGCDQDDGGLTLPPGFCASVFADNLGRARHLTVAPSGNAYVNTWRSSYTELPDSMTFYNGTTFPARYRGGAFVVFHGSHDRAPKQGGCLVAFVPFQSAKPGNRFEEFATGFSGAAPVSSPTEAPHHPMSLAVGPDGALYVFDDVKGRIWRIIYAGEP